ncbi:murein hydrolase activator EnvC [Variovorax sp. Sphag1AA]|uniref:murein hydrolase activator EnvC family protein n=1 Tax=Variovorax sp. Sphag1AA TaxID=2587027 RepID=UPI0017B8C0CC|nr:peptidoglycan DD-metalloendopeptidase family protein [Variovorax sp. Sphag1AA]MBB3181813.1 lipoprotein NlpD [Variovorax sp. Sphag1AA]
MHISSIRMIGAASVAACIAIGLGGCVAPPRSSTSSTSQGAAFAAAVWPAQGPIVGRFDGDRNRGINIAGEDGSPVVAVAEGRVVYAGSQLKGYGNLIIVKHNNEYLTAYAHNRRILVQENDVVLAGQQIAEMGSSGASTTMLHFEVRRSGKAVDPEMYLVGSVGSGPASVSPSRREPYTGRTDMDDLKGLMPAQ